MQCIHFIARPTGSAPEWVRDAWVGLTVPLDPETPYFEGPVYQVGSLQRVNRGGFAVMATAAVDILEHHNPEAARWWREDTNLIYPGQRFLFDTDSCEPIWTLPGLTSPGDPTMITLEELLRQLQDHTKDSPIKVDFTEVIAKECDWESARQCQLNPTLVIYVADVIYQAYNEVVTLSADADEEGAMAWEQAGVQTLSHFHQIVADHGIDIGLEEVEDFFDLPNRVRELARALGYTQELGPDREEARAAWQLRQSAGLN